MSKPSREPQHINAAAWYYEAPRHITVAIGRVGRFLAEFLVRNPGPEIVTVVGYHNREWQDLNVADLRELLALAKQRDELLAELETQLHFMLYVAHLPDGHARVASIRAAIAAARGSE